MFGILRIIFALLIASSVGLRPKPRGKECLAVYDPVCGKDFRTYSNSCWAGEGNVRCEGECPCRRCCMCPDHLPSDPVCGKDGWTYENPCEASEHGAKVKCKGVCPCKPGKECLAVYDPVCGKDFRTYSNSCWAGEGNVRCEG